MSDFDSLDPVNWAMGRLAKCGVESARLEAQLLMGLAVGITRTAVVAGLFAPLDRDSLERFEILVDQRRRRIPLAYLRGAQEFYGLEFAVSPAVLIPRPETEMLVDYALERFGGVADGSQPVLIADVGTGSGCIAIAVLDHVKTAVGIAVDISPDALGIARHNAATHLVDGRLRFVQCDLLSGATDGAFNLILSNPPYIPTMEMSGLQPEVRDAEPNLALDGGPDGLDFYRRLALHSLRCLAPAGRVAVEIGQGQGDDVVRTFADAGLRNIEVRTDLAGIERLVAASK